MHLVALITEDDGIVEKCLGEPRVPFYTGINILKV